MTKATIAQAFSDKMFGAGDKIFDRMVEIGNINSDALKKIGEHQATVASAFVDLGAKQYEMLSNTREAEDLLRSETALGEDFRKQLSGYADGLRQIGEDVRTRYTALAQKRSEDKTKSV